MSFVNSQSLRIFLNSLPLPQACVEQLLENWQVRREIRRGDFLIHQGRTENCLYFVESSTFRIGFPISETEDATVGFGYPGTLLTSFPSLVKNLPSDYFIQAISKGEVLGIPREPFYATVEQFPELALIWRKWVEEALLGRIEREIDLLTPNPADRLERLLKRSPYLFQLIPLKHIASYLRMTPETLSRLRSS